MSYITIRDFGEDKFIEKNQNLLVMLRGAKVKKRQRPLFRKLKFTQAGYSQLLCLYYRRKYVYSEI